MIKNFFFSKQMQNEQKLKNADYEALEAELYLLKSNSKRLQKENEDLRKKLSESNKLKILDQEEFKRKLSIFQKEYQINSNHSTFLKTNFEKAKNNEEENPINSINIQFAMKQSLNINDFKFPEDFEKLKFFRDYFFDDFYTIDSNMVLDLISKIDFNNKLFIDLFILFSCRKEIFDRHLSNVFNIPFFIEEKILILENSPIEWIISSNEIPPFIQDFLDSYYLKLSNFFINILDNQPRFLQNLINIKQLTKILLLKSPESRKISDLICKKKLLNFIDESNISLIPPSQLKILFGRDYFYYEF